MTITRAQLRAAGPCGEWAHLIDELVPVEGLDEQGVARVLREWPADRPVELAIWALSGAGWNDARIVAACEAAGWADSWIVTACYDVGWDIVAACLAAGWADERLVAACEAAGWADTRTVAAGVAAGLPDDRIIDACGGAGWDEKRIVGACAGETSDGDGADPFRGVPPTPDELTYWPDEPASPVSQWSELAGPDRRVVTRAPDGTLIGRYPL